jgi:hypothetical protein
MLVTSVERYDSCMQSLLFSGWGQPVHYTGLFTIVSMRLHGDWTSVRYTE